MQFGVVNPFVQTTMFVNCETIHDAYILAGLSPTQTDHGVIVPGLGIVVYEYGMFTPADRQAYFAVNRRMYAGNAVLYAFDHTGNEVNLTTLPPIIFFPTAQAVERNIALGLIDRPALTADGTIIWQWPEPRATPTKEG
jgi:hypothetical protein